MTEWTQKTNRIKCCKTDIFAVTMTIFKNHWLHNFEPAQGKYKKETNLQNVREKNDIPLSIYELFLSEGIKLCFFITSFV